MISNVFKRLVKAANDLLAPILAVPAVLGLVLSCFESKDGTSSREQWLTAALISLALLAVIKLANAIFRRTDPHYHTYEMKLSAKLDLPSMVPLFVMTLIVLFPFYLLLVSSLKNTYEANSFDFTWWPAEGIDLGSFAKLLEYDSVMGVSIARSLLNSFIYAIIPTTVGLMSSSLAAYAFSKLTFRFKGTMYSILIATMMMPGCVTLSTSYLLYTWYGWTNSPLPLIIPGLFGSASCVMFLREFYMGIPNGLLEAAEIDGAGKWRRYIYILMPMAKPALTAQFILSFISAFNDYLGPLIYLNNPKGYTIQIFMDWLNFSIFDISIIASAGVCALVPMLVLYIIFQKTILSGISISSGLKG